MKKIVSIATTTKGYHYLFETTLVYLIFRELLARDFIGLEKCEVRWEDPYPHNMDKKVDLLLKPAGKPQTFIECKIWKHEYADDLKADINKMRELPADSHRFLLILWWDATDGTQNRKWLEENLPIKILRHQSFETKWRNRSRRNELPRSKLRGIERVQPGDKDRQTSRVPESLAASCGESDPQRLKYKYGKMDLDTLLEALEWSEQLITEVEQEALKKPAKVVENK